MKVDMTVAELSFCIAEIGNKLDLFDDLFDEGMADVDREYLKILENLLTKLQKQYDEATNEDV